MNKQELFLMRRNKKIKLREIAEYIKCSQALISLYERDKANMDKKKIDKYVFFITSYESNFDKNQLYKKGR